MRHLAIVAFWIASIVAISSCTEIDRKPDFVVTLESGQVNIYVEFVDSKLGIVTRFYAVETHLGVEGTRKVLLFENGLVSDGNGKALINLGFHDATFYGLTILPTYPKEKKSAPGLYIVPLFEKGNRVGDGLTLTWNNGLRTFVRAFANIP